MKIIKIFLMLFLFFNNSILVAEDKNTGDNSEFSIHKLEKSGYKFYKITDKKQIDDVLNAIKEGKSIFINIKHKYPPSKEISRILEHPVSIEWALSRGFAAVGLIPSLLLAKLTIPMGAVGGFGASVYQAYNEFDKDKNITVEKCGEAGYNICKKTIEGAIGAAGSPAYVCYKVGQAFGKGLDTVANSIGNKNEYLDNFKSLYELYLSAGVEIQVAEADTKLIKQYVTHKNKNAFKFLGSVVGGSVGTIIAIAISPVTFFVGAVVEVTVSVTRNDDDLSYFGKALKFVMWDVPVKGCSWVGNKIADSAFCASDAAIDYYCDLSSDIDSNIDSHLYNIDRSSTTKFEIKGSLPKTESKFKILTH